jgi:hypothetical protein
MREPSDRHSGGGEWRNWAGDERSRRRACTPEAVGAVMELVRQRGFAVPFPIEVRTVAPGDAMLSTAYGRESARLDPQSRFANAWTDRMLGPVGVPAPA